MPHTPPDSIAARFPELRFNYAILIGDVSCFVIANAFLDGATALPALLTRLGGNAALLGILGAIRQGAYYLPQLFIAHRMQRASRYKPALVTATFFGRIGYFAAAACILFCARSHPAIALAALVFFYTASWLGDGCGTVPWTALISRIIPDRQRGKLFAITQTLGGLAKIGVGALVLLLLSGSVVRFPVADALLVLGCAVFLAISWICLALIREPESDSAPPGTVLEAPGLIDYLKTLPARLRERPDFGRLALVQILATTSVATAPFLWGFMRKTVPGGVPAGDAGKFLIAQTAGLLLLAPVLGTISDRFGPRRSLSLLLALSLIWPVAALGAKLLGGNIVFFYIAYCLLGGVIENWTVITNYLLESVPHDEQSTYIGLMNAASLPALALPLIAGALAQRFGEATAIAFAIVLMAIGLAVARTLPPTRK